MILIYGEDFFVLKNLLFGEFLEIVKGVDNNFEEMFRCFDLKYGRLEKLVDIVLIDIKVLKIVLEGDNKKFIEMVDIVEGCWFILKWMGLGKEMDNVIMISEIEKLLLFIQKREWVLLKIKLKYIVFFDFLRFFLDEKIVIEYMILDIRDSDSGSVFCKGKVYIIINIEDEDNDKFENVFVNVI